MLNDAAARVTFARALRLENFGRIGLVTATAKPGNRLIGSPAERLEDLRLLRGRGRFADDVSPEGVLHAVVLRSSVPHGRIRTLDVSAAQKRPGVVAVLSASDIARECGQVPVIAMRLEPLPQFKPYEQPVIATGRVRYVGEPIAVVVAESAALAEDALEAIVLDIEPLPVVSDREAARQGAALLFEETGTNTPGVFSATRGDAETAFRDAPYVRRERFQVQRHGAVPMEPRGLVASWDEAAGHLTINGAAKVTFANRRSLAVMLGLEESAITLRAADTGGGFGARGEFYPEDFLIPFAARALNRPVKWIEDRREHLMATNHARDAICELDIACDRDGTILAMRGRASTDVGAYLRTNGATASRNIAQMLPGPYRIPHVDIEVTLLVTNKTPVGTYRGPGRFEADFFRERMIDIAARDLGLDPVEMRRRNLLNADDHPWALPHVMPLDMGSQTDSGDYRETLERCIADFGWPAKAALRGRLIDGRYHGIAVGCYIEGGASGPGENARMTLEADGRVSVAIGSSSLGQGVETVFAQIAADALDVPLERIASVSHGSTDIVSQGFGSFSSRSTVMGGSAVLEAAALLKETAIAAAARRFGCEPAAVRIKEDRLVGPCGGRVSFMELAKNGICVEGQYRSPHRTYSYGAHAAHVAVDPRTGHVRIVDYLAVEDVGRIVNPLTLHGQTVGAVVQGLGGTLLEQFVYDDDGQLLTGSFADYLLPTADEFPVVRAVALENWPAPHNPLGAKGAGEGGIIPVGGVIANAVADALAPLGVEPNVLPLSPSRVWTLIQAAKA